jgi:hypothetical protein
MTYRIEPLPRHRLGVLDLLDSTRFAARFTVHGLIEAEVTEARQRQQSFPRAALQEARPAPMLAA